MGRKNRRSRKEYRDRLGFNPRKYTHPAYYGGGTKTSVPQHPASAGQTPRRGDIWFADLGYHPGTSVQGGCRPVLVISNNIGNARAETLNVLPMTRHMKKPDLPCHTVIDPDSVSGAHQHLDDSMLLAEQITTIGKPQLRNFVGKVEDAGLLTQIDRAISAQLGLEAICGDADVNGDMVNADPPTADATVHDTTDTDPPTADTPTIAPIAMSTATDVQEESETI